MTTPSHPSGNGPVPSHPSGNGAILPGPSGNGAVASRPSGNGAVPSRPSGNGPVPPHPPGNGAVLSRPADDGPVLRADAVEIIRDGRHLLKDISLTVRPGEHWALLGANGAGKSTLLGLLGAVTHPSRGVVEVLGRVMGRVDVRELRSYLGHVNPRHAPDGPLRVREVVLTGLTNTAALVPRWTPGPAEEERADQLISMLGMSHRAEARWPTLSQGERGRALIARALMPQPRLLLLDEPATGLDLAAREQLLASIDALRAQHASLATVLVTHHLEELPATTTHAMLLRGGLCLASGPVGEVLSSDLVSECFDHPVRLIRSEDGRWAARAQPIPVTIPAVDPSATPGSVPDGEPADSSR